MKKYIYTILTLVISSMLITSCGNDLAAPESLKSPETTGSIVAEVGDNSEESVGTSDGKQNADAVTEPDYTAKGGSGFDDTLCPVHSDEYHIYNNNIIKGFVNSRVSYEELFAWCKEAMEKDKALVNPENPIPDCEYERPYIETGVDDSGCSHPYMTIKNMINDLGYTRDEINDVLLNPRNQVGSPFTIDVDLLFSDDLQALDEYYRDQEARRRSQGIQSLLENSRFAMVCELKLDDNNEKLNYLKLSMIEFVREYNIPREDFERIFIKYLEKFKADCPTYDLPYDIDVIYGENAIDPFAEVNGRRLNRVELDSIFCGVDNIQTN